MKPSLDFRRAIRRNGHLWLERGGWHLVRSGPGDPIPDTRSLADVDQRRSALPGVDMREAAQLALMDELGQWRKEIGELGIPAGFGAIDVEILYGIVRRFAPRQIIELRSGMSTRVAARAMAANRGSGVADPTITVIDPDDSQALPDDVPVTVRRERVTQVPLDFLCALAPGDIMFLDTSHVLKTGSDVQYLYLEVLPRLPAGALVHIHDVFLPREYPRPWFAEQLRFPSEQYLVQAFLAFNDSFEVVWSSAYMHERHPERLAELLPSYDGASDRQGASLWLRRSR